MGAIFPSEGKTPAVPGSGDETESSGSIVYGLVESSLKMHAARAVQKGQNLECDVCFLCVCV